MSGFLYKLNKFYQINKNIYHSLSNGNNILNYKYKGKICTINEKGINKNRAYFSYESYNNDDKEIVDMIDGISFTIRNNSSIYKEETKNIPIVILHGCYGSKRNFRNFNKMLKSNKIVSLDLPNHGESKHTIDMKYSNIEEDIKNVLTKLNIKSCCLVGFSLGGKVSMYTALKNPSLFPHLIIMDILPYNYYSNNIEIALPYSIRKMSKTLYDIKINKNPKNKLEFLKYLKEELPNIPDSFSQFICMSLKDNEQKNKLTWNINVETIYNEIPNITNFPLNHEKYKYMNPCSFVIAKKSDLAYTIPDYDQIIKNFFPNSKNFILENSSHAVYVDAPHECAQIINQAISV
ncbi:alpha/beta hydrolase, putative [Plasmodium vinckei vinckei]|uniref:Alpha/beta hydrolase, putative n=1 Tax=Plasmodium vinckei vinckei TaxID=54757 RepID=A0A449BT83_PLAVN|nr:alpha/beta hydrolase, putative [Plasmodium vinckei vinckei]KEG02359.1 hypothetical protein YYE_03098 [Plasmodium vinckei vinckei]VEV56602.1 alpha/beta hydrolase, putative [Plasmodium vinckei vinckei]